MTTEQRWSGRTQTVLAGCLGECVHVAGLLNVLRLADEIGYQTVFLGPAVPVADFVDAIRQFDPDVVAVSYRLTPETGEALVREFAHAVLAAGLADRRYCFGGTPPVAERVLRRVPLFEAVFSGREPVEDVIAYLRGGSAPRAEPSDYPQSLIGRLRWKAPFPIIRHHFGLPTVEETAAGIREIAESRVLDVVSLGTDQDAQESFFHPERQDPRRKGAGGVPVRSATDYRVLYAASRCGNYPLMRSYAGTDDLLRLAEVQLDTINNAWCAVPLFWFNAMDGRGPHDLEDSIRTHQEVMAWHAERGIPVELNEPHHWGMRDAPDVVFVVASYLSAYNARAFGVTDYIAQYMFNSPPGLSDRMDLAKMLACQDMVASLADAASFRVYRQTRTGLLSYPVDLDEARGQLAASTYLQMALRPHIVHVVGYTEADHAAQAHEVIESCHLARRVIQNCLRGMPDLAADSAVAARRDELVQEAAVLIRAIVDLARPGVPDPLTDPSTLARAVRCGLLDAPHLKNNRFAPGQIVTRIIDGACVAVDPHSGRPLREEERIVSLLAGAALPRR